MYPDEDSQTTLSKWPFILGDVLLVATALAIAVLGGWQLTDWQVGACVAAVALGAALFVLPYVVEYQVRVREEREDRAADLRILEKHLLNAEQDLAAIDERTHALESALSKVDKPTAVLTGVIDQKLAHLEAARSSQEETIQALQKKLEELPGDAPVEFDPEILKPIEERLRALEAKPAAELVSREPTPAKKTQQATAPSPEATATPDKPEKNLTQIERPKRSIRERHGPEESRLLQRAISEKGHNSSAAVTRIIGLRAKEKTTEASTSPEPEPVRQPDLAPGQPEEQEQKPAHELKESAERTKAKAEPSAELVEARLEKKPQTAESGSTATPVEEEVKSEDTEPAVSKAVEAKPESVPSKPVVKNESGPEPEAVPAQSAGKNKPKLEPKTSAEGEAPAAESLGMLFDEEKITSPVVRTKAKKNDAVITAAVFIGIGNKPYLRGSGGGLSWEKGLPMEFQEVGKWRWVAPSDLDAGIEVQIYCNDEDPDKSGKFTLEPGQKKEITPVF